MKKIINNVADIESELLEGLVAANPQKIRKLANQNIIVRASVNQDTVSIVSGGGSGHEPAHAGYVGYGMLDCAILGKIFKGPEPDALLKGILEVATKKGVLCIVKNHERDVRNFEQAIAAARDRGILIELVKVDDDIFKPDNIFGRRGVAGTVLAQKIAGAAAETGAELEIIKSITQRAIDNTRTIGMAIQSCTIPSVGKPSFEIGEMEMEIGTGIHGEHGIRREPMTNADGIARKLLDRVLSYIDFAGDEVVLMINGMGATPLMELLIVNKFAQEYLFRNGVKVYDTMIGNFMTSLDMAGFSITLMKLDDSLRAFYDASADTFAWKK